WRLNFVASLYPYLHTFVTQDDALKQKPIAKQHASVKKVHCEVIQYHSIFIEFLRGRSKCSRFFFCLTQDSKAGFFFVRFNTLNEFRKIIHHAAPRLRSCCD
ncbi:hypothetical protein BFZC1_21942, partial [Lysinibacillus fusiformis ZC1]